jgi:UDP-N-acetylmuramoylalanine--D-glutamate ligase
VIGEAELALRELAQNRVLGITGTNGKTTVTLLTQHLLNQGGRAAVALGNVGVPFSAALPLETDIIVAAELSSYQLETCQTPCFDRALITNITPDHLDRYPSMNAYVQAKLKIVPCIKEGGTLVVHESVMDTYGQQITDLVHESITVETYGFRSGNSITIVDGVVTYNGCTVVDLSPTLRGRCTLFLLNYLAAVALVMDDISDPEALLSVEEFIQPPHRLQHVATIDGVHYYDDSKATNLDAAIQAVRTLEGSIILLAGGLHKGTSYKEWIAPFKGRVQKIYAFGQAAQLIADDLAVDIPVDVHLDLGSAFSAARSLAQSGDTVLLAPGCSSFDQFLNYNVRGDAFQALVKQ